MLKQRSRDEVAGLRRLSNSGVFGGLIERHRALRWLPFPVSRLAAMLLLPVVVDLLVWLVLDDLAAVWLAVFQFWFGKLGLIAVVTARVVDFSAFEIALPTIELATRAPGMTLWWTVLAIVVAVWLASSRLSDRWIPLRYFLRFLCLIQGTSLAVHMLLPTAEGLTVASHVDSSFKHGVWLMLLVPWIHALVYYIFEFSLLRKAGLTLLTIAFIAVALPMLLIAHAWLLAECSILILAPLYLVFDQWLLVFAAIAIYAWGMTWRRSGVRSGA
jgi:hypothetical protein